MSFSRRKQLSLLLFTFLLGSPGALGTSLEVMEEEEIKQLLVDEKYVVILFSEWLESSDRCWGRGMPVAPACVLGRRNCAWMGQERWIWAEELCLDWAKKVDLGRGTVLGMGKKGGFGRRNCAWIGQKSHVWESTTIAVRTINPWGHPITYKTYNRHMGAPDIESITLYSTAYMWAKIVGTGLYLSIVMQTHATSSGSNWRTDWRVAHNALFSFGRFSRLLLEDGFLQSDVENPSLQKIEPGIIFVRSGIPMLYNGPADDDEFLLHMFVSNLDSVVKSLGDSTFEHETQASTGATTGDWLVMFTRAGCERCTYLRATVEAVAASMRNRKNVAIVDRDTDGGQTTRRFGVKDFPSLILFRLGRLYRYDLPILDAKTLEAFMTDGFRNARGEEIPHPKTPFDDFTEQCADWLRENPSIVNAVLFAGAGLILLVLVAAATFMKSSASKKESKKKK
ncbi:uncharacterized protein LOC134783852 [Penaeus indicus]|uniref:uncharacterized protein LOC134783852 n=1 Tax=Penaeus indicus TaxID=29960 RepID=UPI00300C9FE1